MVKRAKKVEAVESSVAVVESPLVVAATPAPVEPVKSLTPEQAAIAESRKSLNQVLGPEQAFFESPSGYVIVAQKDRDSVWCQKENGGKGMNINKKR